MTPGQIAVVVLISVAVFIVMYALVVPALH